jgi:hypothetical protein
VKRATVQFREVGIPAGFGGLEVCLPGGEDKPNTSGLTLHLVQSFITSPAPEGER